MRVAVTVTDKILYCARISMCPRVQIFQALLYTDARNRKYSEKFGKHL
jgi:hypothetical protein